MPTIFHLPRTLRLVWLLVAVLALVSAPSVAGNIYKWVDDNGVVHYGSYVPPQYDRQRSEVMNSQGMTIDVIPARMTPAEKQAARQRKKAAALRKEQHQRNRLLLSSYRSVADIKHARNQQLATITSRINLLRNSVHDLRGRLKKRSKRAPNGTPGAPAHSQGHELLARIRRYKQALADAKAERARTRLDFAAKIARYKALTRADKAPGDTTDVPAEQPAPEQ